MRTIVEVPLNDNITAEVEIDFICTSLGCPGDAFSPREDPEFDIVDIAVGWLCSSDGFHPVWTKHFSEVCRKGWGPLVEKLAREAVYEEPDLYELMYEAYTNNDPY